MIFDMIMIAIIGVIGVIFSRALRSGAVLGLAGLGIMMVGTEASNPFHYWFALFFVLPAALLAAFAQREATKLDPADGKRRKLIADYSGIFAFVVAILFRFPGAMFLAPLIIVVWYLLHRLTRKQSKQNSASDNTTTGN